MLVRFVPILALAAVVVCLSAGRASAGVAGEFSSLAGSPEGQRVEATIKQDVISASGRADLTLTLKRYRGSFTGLQRGLVRLVLRFSSPRYRKLRDALASDQMNARRLPELRSFLHEAAQSSSLQLMVQKGEWLKQHPDRLRADLATYSALAQETSLSPLDSRLAAMLGRPDTSDFLRGMSPLRVSMLLAPWQEPRTPAGGRTQPRRASSSGVVDACQEKGERAARKAFAYFWRFEGLVGDGIDWAFQHVYYLARRWGPDWKDFTTLGLKVVAHPTHVLEIVRDESADWLLLASVKEATYGTADRIKHWLLGKGWFVPTKIEERAQASDATTVGGACHPAKPGPKGSGGAPGLNGSPGQGPGASQAGLLHWTGTITFDNSEAFSWSNFSLHMKWNVDSYTPEAGVNELPSQLWTHTHYPMSEYTGEWSLDASNGPSSHCAFPDPQTTPPPYYEAAEGSGSGSAPVKGGEHEIAIWPYFYAGEWDLTLSSMPLGVLHEYGNDCWEYVEGQLHEGGYYDRTYEGVELEFESTPQHCALTMPEGFTSPGRIVGSWSGSETGCAGQYTTIPGAIATWDLTVTCPDGKPPDATFACSPSPSSSFAPVQPSATQPTGALS